ncbi:PD40 domain-containing protein [Chondromyces apiculatus]|uniref:TolB protein n=1 Tax=Chondromyces apiculatus DSM 436 TaxID=1192034 RepID=A0A017T6V8_9BACT|nr:PD40 domain-containing protein [Chondromyces apiculatus]EYF04515.1 tolB protein precursor [Chondromyces apiculatus DSM 436]
MRLVRWCTALVASACAVLAAAAPSSFAQGTPQGTPPASAGGDKPPNPDELLGHITVVAGATRPLPKVGILPSLASDMEDVTLRSVVRRDLDLCGEFEVLDDDKAPDGLYLSDSPVDVKAWSQKGVEAVVKLTGKKLSADKAELRAQAYLVRYGDKAVFDRRFQVPLADLRSESHRLADLVIGALTGQNGGFASHMTFASGSGSLRRVFTIDADGHDAKAMSPPDRVAIAPAFGKGDALFYAGSGRGEEYRVYTASGQGPMPLSVKGSVYGLAFSKDRAQVAASIGVGSTIQVFTGPDFGSLKPASPIGMALHPAFTPSGKLAFAGEGKYSQRIFVDGKPISPDGLFASAPTFCNHPDGIKAIFAVGVGKQTDLVASGETGGGLARLTQSQGSNGYPACSPDGRLVAFFSTRKSGEGPGLYVMRVDGLRPKRISNLTGDSLRWDPLPPGKGVEVKN